MREQSLAADLHAAARCWIGTPYLHQASTKGQGCDCLGLVRGLWREVIGAEPEAIPNYTADWSEAARQELLWQAARRHLAVVPFDFNQVGDVLLLRMRRGAVCKHLAILARADHGFSTLIHAYSGRGVVETPLTRPWQRRIVAQFRFPDRRD